MSAQAIRLVPEPASAIHLNRILFATDFSRESLFALPLVSMLARQYHADVEVLHAITPNMPMGEENIDYVPPLHERMQQLLRHDALRGLSTSRAVRLGPPAEVINDEAQDFGADLIVVGTHGFGGVKHFLMGSVSEELARSAPCPIMTVGPNVNERFSNPGRPARILVPVDFTPESLDVIPYVMALVKEYESCVTFLHIRGADEPPRAQTKHFIARMKRLFGKYVPQGCTTRYLVENGDVADTVLSVAFDSYSDLIAMGVRNKKEVGFRIRSSVTYKVMAGAQCPVLISHLR